MKPRDTDDLWQLDPSMGIIALMAICILIGFLAGKV
jgi:hypothetical protein